MATMTMLQMVQEILNDMDSDDVTAYNDTVESEQVAHIIKTTYFDILNERLWPEQREIIQITAPTDDKKPTHCALDAQIQRLDQIYYDKDDTTVVTVTGTTISFNDNGASADDISDSGNGFGSFAVGDSIQVLGSPKNNGTYTVTVAAAGKLNIASGSLEATESAGASIDVRKKTQVDLYEVKHIEPEDFLEIVTARDATASNVLRVTDATATSAPLLILDDVQPTYWTSFDEGYIVFDSYDRSFEENIDVARMVAYGYKEANTWSGLSVADATTFDGIPAKAFPYFLNKCKANCFRHLKQTNAALVEDEMMKQRQWLAREKFRVKGGIKYQNFGRS